MSTDEKKKKIEEILSKRQPIYLSCKNPVIYFKKFWNTKGYNKV